jgi:hypothetical protein
MESLANAEQKEKKVSQVVTNGDWWPDWREQYCAIIASGPTTKQIDLNQLRGRLRVIAIKENVDLVPWADVLYGCDLAFWKNRNGVPEFGGLKISFERPMPGVHGITVEPKADRILLTTPGVVGAGGNSGFQAVNLAAQWGVRGILLIGFDMHDRSGVHWFGRVYAPGRNNPGYDNFRRWIAAFHHSAPLLSSKGIDVINSSMTSALNCFPKMTLAQAFERWKI